MAKRERSSSYDPNHGQGKQKPERPIKVSFADFHFVRMELTEKEKDEFRSLLDSGEFDDLQLDDWLRDGYKFSMSYDSVNSAYVASLTAQYTRMENSGLVLTARGNTTAKAVACLWYKLTVLVDNQAWKAVEALRGGSYGDVG